jgi:hypothetical protein
MGKRGSRARLFGEETPPALRGRTKVSTQLLKIAAKAKQDPKARFTSLAHILTPDFLLETWRQLNRKGASGIDGETSSIRDLISLRGECVLGSPVRETRTPGFTWGERHKGDRGLSLPTIELTTRPS